MGLLCPRQPSHLSPSYPPRHLSLGDAAFLPRSRVCFNLSIVGITSLSRPRPVTSHLWPAEWLLVPSYTEEGWVQPLRCSILAFVVESRVSPRIFCCRCKYSASICRSSSAACWSRSHLSPCSSDFLFLDQKYTVTGEGEVGDVGVHSRPLILRYPDCGQTREELLPALSTSFALVAGAPGYCLRDFIQGKTVFGSDFNEGD